MKNRINCQLIVAMFFLALMVTGCEETVWPDVALVNKSSYLGSWSATNYRTKTSYIRTQDMVTKDFLVRDTTVTDSIVMKFEFGIARSSGKMIEDSIRITSILTKNKIAQAPVIKTGFYTCAETAGTDYTKNEVYINVWEKTANIHTGFANPIAEPYTTYTVTKKTDTDMELSWVLYNNTAQSSLSYRVLLKK